MIILLAHVSILFITVVGYISAADCAEGPSSATVLYFCFLEFYVLQCHPIHDYQFGRIPQGFDAMAFYDRYILPFIIGVICKNLITLTLFLFLIKLLLNVFIF